MHPELALNAARMVHDFVTNSAAILGACIIAQQSLYTDVAP